MRRSLSSLGLAAALAGALFATSAPSRAYAHDQSGVGIGANVTLGGISGLNLNYWLAGNMMLEFMLATSLNFPRPDGTVVDWRLGASVGFFGTLTGNATTNLMLGGRIALLAIVNQSNVPDVGDDFLTIELDVPLRVEHWFDPNFAINVQVGFALAITPDLNDAAHVPNTAAGGIGSTGLFGGGGFTYYFDGTGNPAMAASPSSSSSSSSPPPSSSSGGTLDTGGGSTGTGDQPSWE